ncbi:uncharacterized protein LOC143824265 [Paroedura picta]|uniref:uncharacterized protein LOC143824265 n=1 Tax=Paroedura picta TaxID=143630 RepID=UPI004056FCD6
MERKEQRSGSPARRSGRGVGGGVGGPAEPEAVVQRTQVVLLAGESWEPDSAQAVLSSFAHHVLPSVACPAGPDRRAVEASPASEPSPRTLDSITSEASLYQPAVATAAPAAAAATAPPPTGQASGQLIFFLCRPSSLRERPARLREVLQGVREQSRCAPAALVGVIVQPRQDEEAEARGRLEELLRDVFQAEGPVPVEVHTAIFKPGRPQGALEIKRVGGGLSGSRMAGSVMWLDKSKLMQILGAMLSVGTVAYGGYYYYYHHPA